MNEFSIVALMAVRFMAIGAALLGMIVRNGQVSAAALVMLGGVEFCVAMQPKPAWRFAAPFGLLAAIFVSGHLVVPFQYTHGDLCLLLAFNSGLAMVCVLNAGRDSRHGRWIGVLAAIIAANAWLAERAYWWGAAWPLDFLIAAVLAHHVAQNLAIVAAVIHLQCLITLPRPLAVSRRVAIISGVLYVAFVTVHLVGGILGAWRMGFGPMPIPLLAALSVAVIASAPVLWAGFRTLVPAAAPQKFAQPVESSRDDPRD